MPPSVQHSFQHIKGSKPLKNQESVGFYELFTSPVSLVNGAVEKTKVNLPLSSVGHWLDEGQLEKSLDAPLIE